MPYLVSWHKFHMPRAWPKKGEHKNLNLLMCSDFWGFLGLGHSEPLEVSSGAYLKRSVLFRAVISLLILQKHSQKAPRWPQLPRC